MNDIGTRLKTLNLSQSSNKVAPMNSGISGLKTFKSSQSGEKAKGLVCVNLNEGEFSKSATAINNLLRSSHEHVSPKYTSKELQEYEAEGEYGGITGTLVPSSILRVAKVLTGDSSSCTTQHYTLPIERQLHEGKSVFCDIGSGTGRPSLYMSSTGIKASIGFDIDPMQVLGSLNGLKNVEAKSKRTALRTPVAFFQGDVCRIESLNPVTHAFGFLGYPQIVAHTAALVARSDSVQVFVAVVLHERELKATGLIDDKADVLMLSGMTMPGGNSYTAYVIPMTDERRKVVLDKYDNNAEVYRAQKKETSAEDCQVSVSVDFTRKVNDWLENTPIGKDQLKKFSESKFQSRRRPRKAALKALDKIKGKA